MSVKLKQVFSGKRLDEVHALYETGISRQREETFLHDRFRAGDRAGGDPFPGRE